MLSLEIKPFRINFKLIFIFWTTKSRIFKNQNLYKFSSFCKQLATEFRSSLEVDLPFEAFGLSRSLFWDKILFLAEDSNFAGHLVFVFFCSVVDQRSNSRTFSPKKLRKSDSISRDEKNRSNLDQLMLLGCVHLDDGLNFASGQDLEELGLQGLVQFILDGLLGVVLARQFLVATLGQDERQTTLQKLCDLRDYDVFLRWSHCWRFVKSV